VKRKWPLKQLKSIGVRRNVHIEPKRRRRQKKVRKAVRKWLLKAASKEQNPYFQAEILYQVLKETK
jgi:hypothetical protein